MCVEHKNQFINPVSTLINVTLECFPFPPNPRHYRIIAISRGTRFENLTKIRFFMQIF